MIPSVETNYLIVLVGAIVNMVLGSLWYSPFIFGHRWMALQGHTKQSMEKAKNAGMAKSYILAFVTAFIMSFVISLVISYANATSIADGLRIGFWLWLGLAVPMSISGVLWEGKPWELFLINSSYYLVLFLILSSILSIW